MVLVLIQRWRVLSLLCLSAAGSTVQVTLPTLGQLQGATDDAFPDVAKFLGVPYGVQQRWRTATMVRSWSGVKLVDGSPGTLGTVCVEIPSPAGTAALPGTGEDCLHLNILTSLTALNSNSKLPVWVFFHGGGYRHLGPRDFPCHGTLGALPGPAVVCVAVASRLGVFGFTNAVEVLAANVDANGHHLGGNLGISDQRLALQWIQQYIQYFAGDSTKVMISGQSSGGASVIQHLTQAASFHLYTAASIESGANNLITDMAYANTTWTSLLQRLGCHDLACALNQNTSAVQMASSYVAGKFWPTIDLITLRGNPSDLIASGHYNNKVPIIIGTARDEWFYFMDPTNPPANYTQAQLDAQGPKHALVTAPLLIPPALWNAVKAAYAPGTYDYPTSLGPTSAGISYSQQWWTIQRMLTDRNTGHCCARFAARNFVKGGSPAVYVYLLVDGTDATADPTGHGTCNSFLFPSSAPTALTPAQVTQSTAMIKYWVNFASTGNPNTGAFTVPTWPQYTLTGTGPDTILKLQTGSFVPLSNFRREACDFWDRHFLPYNFAPYFAAGTSTSTSTTATSTTATSTSAGAEATTSAAPTLVTGAMSLGGFTSKDAATAFVQNLGSSATIQSTLATQLQVPPTWIAVSLSVQSRRLQLVDLSARRLQGVTVRVDYTITVPAGSAVQSSAVVAALSTGAPLASALSSALVQAGVTSSPLSVTVLPPVVQGSGSSTAAAPSPSPPHSSVTVGLAAGLGTAAGLMALGLVAGVLRPYWGRRRCHKSGSQPTEAVEGQQVPEPEKLPGTSEVALSVPLQPPVQPAEVSYGPKTAPAQVGVVAGDEHEPPEVEGGAVVAEHVAVDFTL